MNPDFTSEIILQRLETEETQKWHRHGITEKGKQWRSSKVLHKKWGKKEVRQKKASTVWFHLLMESKNKTTKK